MTQAKKRPSKAAKKAQKILKGSKLLATNKTLTDTKAEQSFNPTDSSIKTAGANKKRPNKKRG